MRLRHPVCLIYTQVTSSTRHPVCLIYTQVTSPFSWQKNLYTFGKSALHARQKSPICLVKELYMFGKRILCLRQNIGYRRQLARLVSAAEYVVLIGRSSISISPRLLSGRKARLFWVQQYFWYKIPMWGCEPLVSGKRALYAHIGYKLNLCSLSLR